MYPGVTAMPELMAWAMLGSYLFWGALAVIGAIVAYRIWRSAALRAPARSILEERFARGEIGEEEFRARLAVLSAT
jgi:uncharacterized membrane protein